jgi:two-component system, OmpR family, sensor kinase
MRTVSPLLPTGLRWRLIAWVAGVMLVSAAAIFIVVYTDTGSQLRGQINRDVVSDTSQLSQALRPLAGESPAQIEGAARRYLQAQPYTATSTLLFVLIPGQTTASNHPEVFGTLNPEDRETLSQQTAEITFARRLLTPKIGYSTAHVPDVGQMRIHERVVSVGKISVIAGAGEPLYVVERAQHGIARAFILAGAIILALALLASYLAGERVSAPLRRMAALAARVDAGDLAPRMDVSARRPDELRVLGEAFNHMLDRLEEAFRSQREFVADASHELRTPLTVMRGQLEVLAAQRNPPDSELRRVERLVQAEISRMARLVEDLLVLAKAEQTDFLRPEPIDLAAFVAHLWDGLALTAQRRFELGPVPEGALLADPDRLTQALRNLVRNAIEHTAEDAGLVRLEVERVGSAEIRFAVTDDGPGIPPDQRERVFERFHRTDQARDRAAGGAGLGLAIVRAVANAHGGHANVTEIPGNGRGTRIELVLPGFQPSDGRSGDLTELYPPVRA